MGMLIEGVWSDERGLPSDARGAFVRPESSFRGVVSPLSGSRFEAEPGRYHLFVAHSCPWAHRTILYRRLKRLEDVISISYADLPRQQGWAFSRGIAGEIEPEDGVLHLHRVYTLAKPDYTGTVTVPVLWDRKERTIVNNESSEIIRMLNSAFDAWGDASRDFYPKAKRREIDALNERVYTSVNNGVYRAGFARSQEAYDAAVRELFDTLDMLEELLDRTRYLVGGEPTEADWRLFPTLVRFDVAYYTAFKCNLRRIDEYPNLSAYMRDLYQYPGVSETVKLEAYRHGYHGIRTINPSGIVPIGPPVDLERPHCRGNRSYAGGAGAAAGMTA